MPSDVRSKAQAGFYGAIIAGKALGKGGPTKEQARRALRGSKVKDLPPKAAIKRK